MKILNIGSINTKISTGPRFSIPSFVEAQNALRNVKANLLNITPNLCDIEEMNEYSFEYMKYTKKEEILFENYDLIIFHSFWHIEFYNIMKILIRKKIPYIIVPRGCFTKKALERKKVKKKIALILFFRKLINKSIAIQYLTEQEKSETFLKKYNKKQLIIPNGIKLKNLRKIKRNERNIIYLGRLDLYTKGLDVIVETFRIGQDEFRKNGISLTMYGSDFPEGGKKKLLDLIRVYNLEDIIEIKDPIYGKEKISILEEAKYFIGASRHEGLPMAILEALSYGIKVFITKETNLLDKVLKYRCGWEITHNPIEIKKILIDIISNSSENSVDNGLRLIEDEYSWNKIAEVAYKEYKNLLDEEKGKNDKEFFL